ncbi:hypothetical protein C922_05813, partial [Plasmodium inui San Antonio 1]
NLYEKSEKSINKLEEFSQNSYNPPQLSEECYVVLQNFKGEDMNEIIKSVNDNLFRKMMLDRWIKLHENAKKPVHTLKDHLSYYLGKLKSPYSVDGNTEREQVRNSNHSINTTMRIMGEYHNRHFFHYIVRDNFPESNHDCFINVVRKAFILSVNELVTMEEPQLNKCVLESGILMVRAQR